MQGTPFNLGPLALTNSYTTNIMNPATLTGGTNGGSGEVIVYLRKIRVTNITSGDVTFRLFKGATGANAAGSELFYNKTVPANDTVEEWFPNLKFSPSDFLVGGASASTSLTIEAEGTMVIGD